MKARHLFAILAAGGALFSCVASQKPEEEEPAQPDPEPVEEATVLKVSPRTFSAADAGSVATFTVNTDIEGWDFDLGGCEWLTVKSREGNTLQLEYTGDLVMNEDRETRVTFKAGKLDYVCRLTWRKALMLDVEFQEDGSARDVSANAYDIVRVGTSSALTWYSEEAGRHVARFGHEPGASISSGYYKFDYSSLSDVWEELKDGHSLEAYLMYDAPASGSFESKAFASTESGGVALMVSSSGYGNQLCYVAHNGNWVFNCAGSKPARGRYYHVVAVYDKNAGKTLLYVDGVLKTSNACGGDLRLPLANNYYWFGIGADPGTKPQCAWKGDIAYARIYDAALSPEDVARLSAANATISDLQICLDGICVLSPCVTAPGRTFYIAGTGFQSGDKVRVAKADDGSVVATLELSVEDTRAGFVIPEGFEDGSYSMTLVRGNMVYPLGNAEIEISTTSQPGWKPKVIAHRGFHKSQTENSLGSLRAAQALGVYGSETDFYITTDDSLMVHHDNSIQGHRIDQSTYAEIRACRLSNGENVPTLREYLLETKKVPSTKLIIEVKDHSTQDRENAAIDAMLGMVDRYGMDDQVEYIAFDYESCRRIVAAKPHAMVGYLSGDREPSKLFEEGIMSIDYNYGVLFNTRPAWVAEAQALGMTVNIWTVNDDVDLMKAIGLGVDCITTDNPDRLQELIEIFL